MLELIGPHFGEECLWIWVWRGEWWRASRWRWPLRRQLDESLVQSDDGDHDNCFASQLEGEVVEYD